MFTTLRLEHRTAIFRNFRVISLACLLAPTILSAQDIVLTTKDGGTAISGEFLSFDGSVYQIRTLLGDLNVNA